MHACIALSSESYSKVGVVIRKTMVVTVNDRERGKEEHGHYETDIYISMGKPYL